MTLKNIGKEEGAAPFVGLKHLDGGSYAGASAEVAVECVPQVVVQLQVLRLQLCCGEQHDKCCNQFSHSLSDYFDDYFCETGCKVKLKHASEQVLIQEIA